MALEYDSVTFIAPGVWRVGAKGEKEVAVYRFRNGLMECEQDGYRKGPADTCKHVDAVLRDIALDV